MGGNDKHVLYVKDIPPHNCKFDFSAPDISILSTIPTNLLEAELSKRSDREWCPKCFAHKTMHGHRPISGPNGYAHEMQSIPVLLCTGCMNSVDDCHCQPIVSGLPSQYLKASVPLEPGSTQH